MELASLRSLDDFLLGQARFQVPDINNEDKWFNRIVSNLLYYQTNYFLASFIIFGSVGFFHPKEMSYGIAAMVISSNLNNLIIINLEFEIR